LITGMSLLFLCETNELSIMNIKSLLFFAVGSLFSSSLVIAQTGAASQTQSSTNYTGVNTTSDMTQINTSALPDPLLNTLQGSQQFKGWESGQWYFNSTTNQYSVQMPATNSGMSTNPTTGTSQSNSNPVAPSNPTQVSPTTPLTTDPLASPTNPTTSPANPTSTTPATSTQLPATTITPQTGTTTAPTWYRFDQTGRLIPQPKDN